MKVEEPEPSYYAIITAEVRYDRDLSPLEKLLYGEITALAKLKGFCWATNNYFADLYDRDGKYISSVINKLLTKGYIRVTVDKQKGNIRKIWINNQKYQNELETYPDESGYLSRNSRIPIPKNREYNSIINKTKNNNKETERKKELPEREVEFTEEVTGLAIEINFPSNELPKFLLYWTQISGARMMWEKQRVFDIKRRLGLWQRNNESRGRPQFKKKWDNIHNLESSEEMVGW